MKFKTLAIAIALATPAWAAPQDNPPSTNDKTANKLSDAEQQEIMHLHHVNQFEIDMAKMAQTNGSAQIKGFVLVLINDHQRSDKDITALAKKKNISLTSATATSSSDADAQEMKDMMTDKDRMKTMKGKDFDKEFLAMMMTGHTKELARIETSLAAAKDPDVVTLLKNTKPVLQKHIDMARDAQKKVDAQASK
jgi:putative membrane protein